MPVEIPEDCLSHTSLVWNNHHCSPIPSWICVPIPAPQDLIYHLPHPSMSSPSKFLYFQAISHITNMESSPSAHAQLILSQKSLNALFFSLSSPCLSSGPHCTTPQLFSILIVFLLDYLRILISCIFHHSCCYLSDLPFKISHKLKKYKNPKWSLSFTVYLSGSS